METERPKCPTCKSPICYEPASTAGPERVYCICGWSLYRPDRPAVATTEKVETTPARVAASVTTDGKHFRGTCHLCKREDVLLTSKNGECYRCYKRTAAGLDPLSTVRPMPGAKVVGKQEAMPAWVANALSVKTLIINTVSTRSAAMSDNTHHTLGDLNDRLFSQLDRIIDGTITGEKLKAEIDRTRAISSLAKEMIDNARLVLEVERTLGGKTKPGLLTIVSK